MRMFHLRRPEQKPLKQQQQQQQQQQKTSEEPRSQPGALYGKEMIGDSFDFDVFSTNLDDTLQVLEEEGLDNASVKDIMFDSLQRNRSSLMTTSISSDTASLTSSHGDYDIPCEESSTLSAKTHKPTDPVVHAFPPDSLLNVRPNQTSTSPCYFIDFEKSQISQIQIPKPHQQSTMVNSNLCYQYPKVLLKPLVKTPAPEQATANASMPVRPPKPAVIGQNLPANFHQSQQRQFAGGFNATPVLEPRQQRSPMLNNKPPKKQRSKSSSGFPSKSKNAPNFNLYSEDSDTSSCITQSTVRCVYKQNPDFNTGRHQQGGNRSADLFVLHKNKRVNSNISNLGKTSLTDESESTRSVFTDVQEVRNASWFSRDKKKRIRKMLKMYNNDNSSLYNNRNSSCTKVVLAEL